MKYIKTFEQFIMKNAIKSFIRKTLNENLNEIFNKNNYFYEFHLSTEPDLKEGLPFSKQIRTNSSYGERGTMNATETNNVIFTTDTPEAWFDQFQMELGVDAPEAIPNNLYLVKVKIPSKGSYLSQAENKPEDVIVIKKIPNKNGIPDFNVGYRIKTTLENK